MKCQGCGDEVHPGDPHCGACGARLAEPAPPPDSVREEGSAPVNRLRQELHRLAEALAWVPVPGAAAAVAAAAVAAAAGPNPDPHTTVVLGEKARGKTTLVNRLLRQAVLPTGRKGVDRTVRVRRGPTWRTLSDPPGASAEVPGPPFLAAPGAGFGTVEGPADILQSTSLVDTVALNVADAACDDSALREALTADLILVCLSAEQMLSASERFLIREHLLPLTSSEVIAVVNRVDGLDADDRRQLEQRLARFVDRAPAGRLRALFVSGGADPTRPVEELEAIIRASAQHNSTNQEQAWAGRVSALLQTLQRFVAALPEPSSAAASPEVEQTPGRLEALLEREHRLALQLTEGRIRSQVAGLRLTLPDRFAEKSLESMRNEGLTQLFGEVQAVGREATETYLTALKAGLNDAAAPEVRASAEGLSATGVGLQLGAAERPDLQIDARPNRDSQILALTGLGAVLLLSTRSLVPIVGGALAIYGAHHIRRIRQQQFAAQLRHDSVTTLQDWLSGVEDEFITRLRESTAEVVENLRRRLSAVTRPLSPAVATEAKRQPGRAELSTRLAACRAACDILLSPGDVP